MGKIIKYEWRKQRASRLIILFGLLGAFILFAFGVIRENSTSLGVSAMLMIFGAFLVLFYTGIESLIIFNRDLRTKQSHMLWMLPKSVYEILGGKFLAPILQMLFVFVSFVLTACLCFLIIFLKSSATVEQLFKFAQTLTNSFLQLNIDWKFFVSFITLLFLSWTSVIMVGFLSIIISRTLFLKSKFSGLFSIILFFIITYLIEQGYSLISNTFGYSGFTFRFLDLAYYAIVCVALFLASGILADKKLSV